MIDINLLKNLSTSNKEYNNSEDVKNLYYHIFDNVKNLNENHNIDIFNKNLNNSVLNNKLEQINTRDLEYLQNKFIDDYEEYNKNHIEVDVLIDEKNSFFKLAEIDKEGNIPSSLLKILNKFFHNITFTHVSVCEENSIFFAILILLDKTFIFKTDKDCIVKELKSKLLMEISGDKLFSFFKMHKLKTNIEKIHNEFNKNIINETTIVLLEKYFDINFLIYDVINKNFIEREIYKISNFYILLKFKNAYYPVINKQNIIFNIREHKDFLLTIKSLKESNIFNIDYIQNNKKEEINNINEENNNIKINTNEEKNKIKNINQNSKKKDLKITNFSKMKKDELIKICNERNIEYEYIDDKTKKIKTLTKQDIINRITNT